MSWDEKRYDERESAQYDRHGGKYGHDGPPYPTTHELFHIQDGSGPSLVGTGIHVALRSWRSHITPSLSG